MEFPTDNAYDRRGTNSNFHKMSDGTLLSNNAYTKAYWENSYAKIARCNRFLEGIGNLSDSGCRGSLHGRSPLYPGCPVFLSVSVFPRCAVSDERC